ncbi:hypothetical protein EDC20_1251, partial [Gluconobacter oxydans]
SRNSGGKRFDLLLMNSSYLTGLSVSTKPGAIHKELKQRVRDIIAPERDLGHTDRTSDPQPER